MVGVAQQGGGVEGGHHQHAVFLEELPVLLGDLDVGLDQLHGGHPAQAHQNLGPEQGELVAQPADAGLLLLGEGVPVLRGPALDDIGDVDVALPVQVHRRQELIQVLAGPAHKGLSLQVLVLARALSHEHHLGLGVAHPEHHVVAGLAKAAGTAVFAGGLQFVPVLQHERHFSSRKLLFFIVPQESPRGKSRFFC